jgi:hypothetical protein
LDCYPKKCTFARGAHELVAQAWIGDGDERRALGDAAPVMLGERKDRIARGAAVAPVRKICVTSGSGARVPPSPRRWRRGRGRRSLEMGVAQVGQHDDEEGAEGQGAEQLS